MQTDPDAVDAAVSGSLDAIDDPALRAVASMCDALMTRPGDLDPQVVADLRRSFSHEQLVEMTLKVMKFNIQKTMVALGTDDPIDADAVAGLIWNPGGQFIPA